MYVDLQPVQHNCCVLYKWHGAVTARPTDVVRMLCKGTYYLMGEAAM